MNIKPLVAIHCLVYNHEPYLRDCFEGFVMQQTNFPFVAIVHDDASTDGSAVIIREYEEKYPHIFKPIYEVENQYTKGTLATIMDAAIDATGAKYIAMCEGDDYWTDPLKLQKQLDFLEANPIYGTCCHRFSELPIDCIGLREDHFGDVIENDCNGLQLNKNNYLEVGKLPQILTTMYRHHVLKKSKFGQINVRSKYDQSMFYALVQVAPIWIMNDNMGVYRRHSGGIATSIQGTIIATKKAYYTWKDVNDVYRTEETKEMFIGSLKTYIYQYVKTYNNFNFQDLSLLINELSVEMNSIPKLLYFYIRIVRAYLIRLVKITTVH